ncbi:lipopolysaccharide heptosyltransferase family protein [bacterium]|nr:lipopolysaccharide heptosyltransferase family protein [bacterium]
MNSHMNMNMNILLIRPLPLGNATYALPFVEAINKLPGAHKITVLACPLSATVFENHPAVSQTLVLPSGKLTSRELFAQAKLLRSHRFDVAFLMKTGGSMERLAWLARIPHRVGYKKAFFQLLTHRYSSESHLHISMQSVQLLRYFFNEALPEISVRELRPQISLAERESAEVEKLLCSLNLKAKTFFTVHPMGTTVASVGLNHDFYTHLAPKVAEKFNLIPVYIGAPSEEPALKTLAEKTNGQVFISTQSPRRVLQLLSQARLHVGNDSGWAHVAEALGIPKIVLYPNNNDNFQRWKPLSEERSKSLFRTPETEILQLVENSLEFIGQVI